MLLAICVVFLKCHCDLFCDGKFTYFLSTLFYIFGLMGWYGNIGQFI